MEKRLVTRLTVLVVALSLIVVLGAAFWRASHRTGGEENHQHNHHSRVSLVENPAC